MKKLSREQMKNVMGGKAQFVTCFVQVGYTQIATGSCSGTAAACQTAANTFCANTAGCISCLVGPAS